MRTPDQIGDIVRQINERVYELHSDYDALRTELERVTQQRDELVKALESITEYWNRDENEKAMSNALWYTIDLAESTLNRIKEQP